MTESSSSDPFSIPPHVQRPQPSYPQYQPYPPYQPPPQMNGMAIASFVLGLVGITIGWVLFAIPSILAVVFGHVALSAIRNTGQQGRGMAIAGLVTGYIVVGVVVLALLFAP